MQSADFRMFTLISKKSPPAAIIGHVKSLKDLHTSSEDADDNHSVRTENSDVPSWEDDLPEIPVSQINKAPLLTVTGTLRVLALEPTTARPITSSNAPLEDSKSGSASSVITTTETSRVSSPRGSELYHEEVKNFWKPNRGVHITMLKHASCQCLELIATDASERHVEASNGHIFIDMIKLAQTCTSMMGTAENDAVLFGITRPRVRKHMQNKDTSVDIQSSTSTADKQDSALKKFMTKYLMDRIAVEPGKGEHASRSSNNFSVALRPLPGDDTQIVNGQPQLTFICSKPYALQFSDVENDDGEEIKTIESDDEEGEEEEHMDEFAEEVLHDESLLRRAPLAPSMFPPLEDPVDQRKGKEIDQTDDEQLKQWEMSYDLSHGHKAKNPRPLLPTSILPNGRYSTPALLHSRANLSPLHAFKTPGGASSQTSTPSPNRWFVDKGDPNISTPTSITSRLESLDKLAWTSPVASSSSSLSSSSSTVKSITSNSSSSTKLPPLMPIGGRPLTGQAKVNTIAPIIRDTIPPL